MRCRCPRRIARRSPMATRIGCCDCRPDRRDGLTQLFVEPLTNRTLLAFTTRSPDFTHPGGAKMPVVAVIDDEPIACDVVAGILRDGGTDVHTATTAEAGLALLTSRYFDLALIDVRLRDGSGIKLAEIAANQNTLVLLMTGHAETASYLKQFDFPRLL